MAESQVSKLPQFNSLEGLVEFFDTHDMVEYEEEMTETNFDIDIK
ncbi:MAG TPA: hypothetical protein VK203_13005 [Nostocaceae cyanobacterium]|nr:hypothetical protein [Nostocaceae cyanobacterium]